MARNDSDNARTSARNLGVLGKEKKVRGTLGVSSSVLDLDDFFKFKLNSRQGVTLSLTGLQRNADLRLQDTEGNTIASSKKRSKKSEKIARNLDAGNYYVQVSQDGVNTKYVLTASAGEVFAPGTPGGGDDGGGGDGGGSGGGGAPITDIPTPIKPSSDPGSIPATAFDTGKLSGVKAYQDTVGGADTADFYRFSVDRSSKVIITSGNFVDGTVDTRLIYDINGNDFVDEGDVIASGNVITKALGAGTYFIGVTPSSGDKITYTIKLEESAITGITTTNDPPLGLGGATDLGTVQGSLNVKQVVSSSDTTNPTLVGTFDSTDIYKFNLTSVSNFSALLNSDQLTGDVTMSLIYDDDGNGIANPGQLINGLVSGGNFIGGVFTGGSGGGSALAITKTLGEGTYYIAVTQRKVIDNTTYNLNLFVNNTVAGINPGADPGNSIGSAFGLGSLNQNVSFKQFVGSVDGSDFYSFTIDQPRNIVIRYNGSRELVALRFGVDRNGNGVFDPGEDVDNNGRITFNEDLNNNGILDPGEDTDKDGYLKPSEDRNLNGILDPNEVFEQSLNGDVVYSPLPPLYDSSAKFEPVVNGFLTTVPTDIYARLGPGTYFFQVDAQSTEVDLGDGLTRYGSANVLYNLSFILDG